MLALIFNLESSIINPLTALDEYIQKP